MPYILSSLFLKFTEHYKNIILPQTVVTILFRNSSIIFRELDK